VVIDTNKDFIISTKMNHVSGITNHGYGLVFGRDATGNFQYFQISADGHFQVGGLKNKQWRTVKNWTKSKHILTGNNTNTLQMEKRGDIVNFYINGYFVHKMNFQTFAGNYLGFIVNRKQKVGVSNLTVMYL
jgi:ribosomal protein L21E